MAVRRDVRRRPDVSYQQLAYLHLATVLPAFVLGTWLMLRRKGTTLHKQLGKAYLSLMLLTAMVTLFMPAQVGPTLLGHFGFIHLLSLNVMISVPVAYLAARSGNIRKHQLNMIGLYVFGLLVAGSLALMPGRLLHDWLFS